MHTIAGAPVAPLDFGCGFKGNNINQILLLLLYLLLLPLLYLDDQPATLAAFDRPRGIAGRFVYSSTDNSASDTSFLYIADTNNHVIRGINTATATFISNANTTTTITGLSAVCTQICENGGKCTGPDKCTCPKGQLIILSM